MSDKIQLTEKQWTKIQEHTLAVYPEEMCGLLTAEDFIPVENSAEDRKGAFRIAPEIYAEHWDSITAVVHSHCRGKREPEVLDLRTPSYKDMLGQKATQKPWLIVGCEGETVSPPLQFPRVPSNNYLGRHFLWFINDCYTLVQDWYKFELGIELKEYVLQGDYKDIRNLSDLFMPYIADYGFVEVPLETLCRGDLLMLDHGNMENNHLAVYTGTSVIHQDMVSVELPLETFLGRIKQVLRYVGNNS